MQPCRVSGVSDVVASDGAKVSENPDRLSGKRDKLFIR
ncbi:hypothetical protein D777_01090 [Marinobacter nitratireducens]|uniref:Uncharacterized protein n=1 Tax=Marinobacter nitratireducens TaxID=1137280 RepID=A0A072N4K5_9GAMM|nr:hypothetical protein D777_01090 [Marinobacter nitratireducens]